VALIALAPLSLTSQSGKIRKCCVDQLNPLPKADADANTGGNYSFAISVIVITPSSRSAVNENTPLCDTHHSGEAGAFLD
jgi:hypothetical protein